MQKVLFIGLVFPESTSTAAGSRMLQLITFFKEQHVEITFASTAQKSDFSDDLETLGVKTVSIVLNNTSFDDFVKELNPTIVVFDRFITEEQFGWRVAESCPKTMRILDTEDLHCLRFARQIAFQKKEPFTLEKLFELDTTKREIASIYRCDLSLLISTEEHKILTQQFHVSEEILHTIPFLVAPITKEILLSKPSFEQRVDFMTIGNFLHQPNWQAVVHLKNTIWPLIRKQLPKAKIIIYGAYTTQKVLDLHNEKQGFLVKGRVESASKVISEAKVLLAPILFGAGLKGKLLEAMQNGTPSVTTTIGAEAMHINLLWNGFITDNTQEFVDKAVALYTDKKVWKKSQNNGINIVNTLFSKEEHSKLLLHKIRVISENLNTHKNRNFIGAMLQHHTLKSTKYLGKWIEEKNN